MNKTARIFITAALLLTAVSVFNAQSVTTHDTEEKAKQAAGKGITYKIPDNVMPMKWHNFRGMLMLAQKLPSGVFISYPEEGESLDDLTVRAERSIAKMFVRDDKTAEEIIWSVTSVPAKKGDRGETAKMKTFDDDKQTLQITFFEREWNGLKFVYGYFGRKSKTSKDKDDSAQLLDDKGEGVKVFDKFWKTFPAK